MAEEKLCRKCSYSDTDHMLACQINEGLGIYGEMAKKFRKDILEKRFFRICDKFEEGE